MAGNTRAPVWARARTARLARLLLGPNRLRRPCDRLEGVLVMLLAAAFLVAVAAAPSFAEHLYQSQRADAAQLHAATAVRTQNGPSDNYVTTVGEETARWRAPDGQAGKGRPHHAGRTWHHRRGGWDSRPGVADRLWAARGSAAGCRRVHVQLGHARHRRADHYGGRAPDLLLAGPPGTRPAAPSRVDVRMVPDRSTVDDPALTAGPPGTTDP
jgi:hypothetical protein